MGEADSVKYSKYTGWEMHIPEGRFKYEVGYRLVLVLVQVVFVEMILLLLMLLIALVVAGPY